MNSSFNPKFNVVENPHNEKFKGKLDMVIIIPAFKEGIDILKTIYSDVIQIKEKHVDYIHGIVVVINRKKNSKFSKEDEKSNLETLKLLYYLSFGVKFTKRGGSEEVRIFNERVQIIQESGVPIYIVDATSEEYLNEDMNVGMARKIGTELVADNLMRDGDDVVFFSQDADTIYGEQTLASVYNAVRNNIVDAGPLSWGHDYEGLNEQEMLSVSLEHLMWKVREGVSHTQANLFRFISPEILKQSVWDKHIENKAIWMQGAGSFFNRKFLRQSKTGYEPKGFSEDTSMIHGVVENKDIDDEFKAKIESIEKDFPGAIMYTRPRHSTRPDNGYGHSMIGRSHEKGQLADAKVESLESIKKYYKVVQFVSVLVFEENGNFYNLKKVKNAQSIKKMFVEFLGKLEFKSEQITELYGLLEESEGVANSRAHHNFLTRLKKICEENYPSDHFDHVLDDYSVNLRNYRDFFISHTKDFCLRMGWEEDTEFRNFYKKTYGFLSESEYIREAIISIPDLEIELYANLVFQYRKFLDIYYYKLMTVKFLQNIFETEMVDFDEETRFEIQSGFTGTKELIKVEMDMFMVRTKIIFLDTIIENLSEVSKELEEEISEEHDKVVAKVFNLKRKHMKLDYVSADHKLQILEKHKDMLVDMGLNVSRIIDDIKNRYTLS